MKKEFLSILALGVSLQVNAGNMGVVQYDFDGFNIGAGAGFTNFFINDSHSISVIPGSSNSETTQSSNTGAFFEGHLGYGKMFYGPAYLGIKGSIYYTPLKYLMNDTETSTQNAGTFLTINNNSNRITLQPIYNIDAVLGYEVYPHILPFIEGGVSFADVRATNRQRNSRIDLVDLTNFDYTATLTQQGYKTGYNLGVGASFQATPRWILSSEIVYNYLGKNSASDRVALPPDDAVQTITTNKKFQLLSLFGSVSYQFTTL